MFHLGVPTTRALSLISTGETVVRDMFYDGNPQGEMGAVVCRVAPSFIRFGNFEILAAQGDRKTLAELCDFTIKNHFPHLLEGHSGKISKEIYLNWFREVSRLSAAMVVEWMRVGFVHGVMNTDNMSILGLTIDYGPYGWLENYDPDWTPNTTDAEQARYRFSRQPYIVQWNLYQLANSLMLLIEDGPALENILTSYGDIYTLYWQQMMANKLGFKGFDPRSDEQLINDLDDLLIEVETDMTIFFRKLSELAILTVNNSEQHFEFFSQAYYQLDSVNEDYKNRLHAWLQRYKERLQADGLNEAWRHCEMKKHNPKYVLRNYMAQMAIDASEKGDHSILTELLDVLKKPYDEQFEFEHWFAKRPEWARERAGCSMLSCSS